MHAAVNKPPTRADISAQELLETLWRGRLLICCITLAFTVAMGVAAWLLPKKYEVHVVLSPVTNIPGQSPLSPSGSLASPLGSLASLAGMSLSVGSRRAESMAVLKSDALIEKYIRDNNLLPVLYASLWDPATQTWRVSAPADRPTLWKAEERFKEQILKLKTDPLTGLVTLTIAWRDPAIAATWANGLVRMANDYLRARDIDDAERNITFLNAEAAKTPVVEVKRVIFSVLKGELSKSMLARGSEQYAFEVVDPAIAPENESYPQEALWLCVGFVLGLACAGFVVFLRAAIR